MIIQSTSSLAATYLASQTQSAQRQAAAATTADSSADTVTISSAARQAMAADESSQGVEIYAIPQWMADLGMARELQGGSGSSGSLSQSAADATNLSPSEQQTYSRLLDQHYSKLLQSNGIDNAQDHYQALIKDRTSSEALHQQMLESIKSDPTMVSLLEKAGRTSLLG